MQQLDWTLKIPLHPDVTAIFASNWGLDQLWLLFHWTFPLILYEFLIHSTYLNYQTLKKSFSWWYHHWLSVWSWDLSHFFNSTNTESPWTWPWIMWILRIEKIALHKLCITVTVLKTQLTQKFPTAQACTQAKN